MDSFTYHLSTLDAPRMDLPATTGTTLYRTTLAGDLVSNAMYYSLVGAGQPDSAV